jgi:integrase
MSLLRKSPHYLIRNRYSYCFRMIVPRDLQQLVGKKELRYSLKTGYVGVARVKAQMIAAQVHQIFACLRSGRKMVDLSDEKIQELVQQYLKEYIEGLESRYHDDPPFLDRGDFYGYIDTLDYIKEDIIEYLGIGEYGTVEEIVADLLKKNEKEGVEKGSAAYIKLCRGVLRAQLKGIEIEKKHMSGDFPETLEASFREQLPSGIPIDNGGEKGQLISEVIEQYADEAKANWQPKTKDENLSILNLFMEVVGDVPIQSITRRKVGEFKQTLQKLPPNLKKNPKYRRKSISKIIQMQVPKTISDTTVGKYLTRIGALFEYARRNGIYEGANPATGMNPPKHKRAHEPRAPFAKDELVKLFRSEDYLEDRHDKPYQFWMPILALFTGARLNELAQLHLSDIRQAEEGVWVFDINDEAEKRVKAKSSRRIIPIHSFLLDDLKFLSYVEHLKAKGEQRLFPELKEGRDGYGRNVSRWFNEIYRQKCGILLTDGRKRDFHSFRSTFVTHLVYQKVNDRMRLQVEGHSAGKDMTNVYADPFPAKQLYDEVISKLDYGIDLSHLKNSRFVIKDSSAPEV